VNEKCPMCGNGEIASKSGPLVPSCVVGCSCCCFQCCEEHLPRIAAAMELAASTVEFTAKVNPVLMRHRYAHDRVLGVFGGE